MGRFVLCALVSLLIIVISVGMAFAAVPSSVTAQGKLTDSGGLPLPAGVKTFTFRVYDAASGGTKVWPVSAGEIQSVTTSTEGLWTALVGAVEPLNHGVFADTLRWLEIEVDATILPRVRLVTGPYAYRAGTVDGASGGTITSKVSIGSGHTNSGAEAFVAGTDNQVTGNYSNVGGGTLNNATGESSTIAGGQQNDATGFASSVGGGASNLASNTHSTVGGGLTNTSSGLRSVVDGGAYNNATSEGSVVGGGGNNHARGQYSTISGGGGNGDYDSNATFGDWSTVGGGRRNSVHGHLATVSGGEQNSASGQDAFVGGGASNWATAEHAAIAGGSGNLADSVAAFVGGGYANWAYGRYSSIAGGFNNRTNNYGATVGGGRYNWGSGDYATVGGGGGAYSNDGNLASGEASTIGGGRENNAANYFTTIAGGWRNSATGHIATVGGGVSNRADGQHSTVSGGNGNHATNNGCVVGGGGYNLAAGNNGATVPGGYCNYALGDASFAAGNGAKAVHSGSFVWNGTTNGCTDSLVTTGASQFLIRAPGGVGIGTNAPQQQLSVADGMNIDQSNLNVGTIANSLRFGSASGEAIASKRDAGGNQFGLDFYTSSINRMSISNANGYVGIGTASPVQALDVNGTLTVGATVSGTSRHVTLGSDPNAFIQLVEPDGSGTPYIDLSNDAVSDFDARIMLTGDDQLAVEGANVSVAGNVCASNLVCPSDERLKEGIHPLRDAVEQVERLHGVSYHWNDAAKKNRNLPNGEQIGLLAQEVRKVVPQAVIEQSDGYLAVDYARLVPLLIEGMKEQQRQIEELRARLDRQSP